MLSSMIDFDDFMRNVPMLALITSISAAISWAVIRGAVLSALRKHSREQRDLKMSPRE